MYKLFDKFDIRNYGQLLFERFIQRYEVDRRENQLAIEDYNYHEDCCYEDVIDTREWKEEKTDSYVSLTCCQKGWHGVYETVPEQCAYCHRSFRRHDIYQTYDKINFYCNICWIYQNQFRLKPKRQSLSIRCNLCGEYLLDKLTEDIIAMNFVHLKCLEKHLNYI